MRGPRDPVPPPAVTASDLRQEHVEAVFREFLGRPASPGDVAHWLPIGSLSAFLDGVLASEEYAARVSARAANEAAPPVTFINCWSDDLQQFARPVGSISADGVAIVGERGFLFLHGGSNDNVATHRGRVTLDQDWLEGWITLIRQRDVEARAAGRSVAYLVVPDKLAVYEDHYPGDLTSEQPRPIMRLRSEAQLPLIYPCEALRAARVGGPTFLLTDSHLSVRGNQLLARVTLDALGVPARLLDDVLLADAPLALAGDLGQHFEPPVVEISSRVGTPSKARIVADNWPQVRLSGGHIGTRRVFRQSDPPDSRTVVVFGDSYGFGDDAYQGLSWFLAQIFREVHFVWAPFGWDPDYLDRVGAELAVCQTAERFIGRRPIARINAQKLVDETIARRDALSLERVFVG